MSQHGQTPQMVRRREVLRRAAWLLGGAISAPAALAILQGCKPGAPASTGASAWKGAVLTADEGAIVTAVADILIPKTETHGALDAGVPAFIDSVLGAVYPKDSQERFRKGCAAFASAAREAGGKPFLDQDAAARSGFVKTSLESALAADADDKPFILMTRELTLLGFFSSEVGITENMEYVAVPTAYHGCVPLSQMKKHVYWE